MDFETRRKLQFLGASVIPDYVKVLGVLEDKIAHTQPHYPLLLSRLAAFLAAASASMCGT